MTRIAAVAALALAACPSLALAAATTSASQSAADAVAAGQPVRVAMRQATLPPGGRLPEEPPAGQRYFLVVSGRLKVSDLVTGEEQVVEAGKMAAERPGDWSLAEAVGDEPVTLYIIERAPVEAAVAASAGGS